MSRVADMQLGSAAVGGTRRPQPAASVDGNQGRYESRFAGGEARAGDALLKPGESMRDTSVAKKWDREKRHGVDSQSRKGGRREMGSGISQPVTD